MLSDAPLFLSFHDPSSVSFFWSLFLKHSSVLLSKDSWLLLVFQATFSVLVQSLSFERQNTTVQTWKPSIEAAEAED